MFLENIAMLFQGVGAGLSAGTAYNNSEATQAALNAQAQINRNNAVVAGYQAADSERRGAIAASNVRIKARQLKGAQRARLAASGVDLGTGNAADILTDTDYFGEVDAATTLDNAAREAWGYRTQAQNFQSESDLLRSRAKAEKPWLAAGTSLLSSATRMAPGWYADSGVSASSPRTRRAFDLVDYQKRGDN